MSEASVTRRFDVIHRDSGRSRTAFLTLAALGVVYGDIGTSPLYALRECFGGVHAIAVTPANVLGVLSLIFWSLIVTVSIKYVLFVMRADNGGEGGILGSMIGALTMAFLRNGSQQMGWPNYVQEILIGVIIVMAVALDRFRHARQEA